MERRHFLQLALAGAAVGTGGLFARRAVAREGLASRFLGDALPPLAERHLAELREAPARAGEEIRRRFDGACLNAHAFAHRVCSAGFAERLAGCREPEQRDACFMEAYAATVATEASILGWVEATAAAVGAELDAGWATYCAGLSRSWGAGVAKLGPPLDGADLTARIGWVVRFQLDEAIRQAAASTQPPALTETAAEVGKAALMLLPLAPLGTAVAVPLFILLAARPVWAYVAGLLEDRRPGCQAAISGRLAAMGIAVGVEFEAEERRRVADLHHWREEAVRAAAGWLADRRVGLMPF